MWFVILIAIWLWVFDGMDPVKGWINGGTKSEWTDRGYNDGYAVGWEKICGGTSIIYGQWSNSNYTEAYYEGEANGQADAKRRKCR